MLPPLHASSESWHAFWADQQQPWRTAPLIADTRARDLLRRYYSRSLCAEQRFPFANMHLTRGDLEWLCDLTRRRPRQRLPRAALDLRGADLSGEDVSYLPLQFVHCGLTLDESISASGDELEAAATRFTHADLRGANLSGGTFRHTHFEQANLTKIFATGASFASAHFNFACLRRAHLRATVLSDAHFDHSDCRAALFEQIVLPFHTFTAVDFSYARFRDVSLVGSHFIATRFAQTRFATTNLAYATFEQCDQQGIVLVNGH